MDDSFATKFGVAIFDTPLTPSTGWACVYGRDPIYLTSTGDLETDVFWITNIDWSIFTKIGLQKTPRFRPDNFLRTKLSSIITEIGLREVSKREQVKSLSEVVGATMQFANVHLGITAPPFGALNNGIRQIFLPSDQPEPMDVIEASESASQPYVSCEKTAPKDDDELIPVLMHRYQYAKQILASRLPAGRWVNVNLSTIGTTPREIDNWVVRCEKPLLLKVRIERMDSLASKLINYGNGAGLQMSKASMAGGSLVTLNNHEWVTSIEYRMLREHGTLSIEKILMADGWASNPVSLPIYGQFGEFSYSLGLYCESLWTSLTRSLNGKSAKTPISAWIHSIDRILCFQKAKMLTEDHDLVVHGYGYGRIMLRVSKEMAPSIPNICLKLSLISPMLTIDKNITAQPPPGQATSAQLLQVAMMRGERSFLYGIDKKALAESKKASMGSKNINFSI